jgi:urease accessory protein
MRRATHIANFGEDAGAEAGAVTLPYADRHKRRIRLSDDAGDPFMLDLAEVARLKNGDKLLLEGGGHIRVAAAEERVAEIRTRSAVDSACIAWHIGNRHVELQVVGERHLRILWDHVLVHMLTDYLGATVSKAWAPFEPEVGAYAAGDASGLGHHVNHSHGHAHDHAHDHRHHHGLDDE